ncbi:MAG: ABC transporter substrate-binding protein [Promethearchaeota archaeon]|jgi:ABC-type transport system substrate-binding protein
MNSEKTDPTKVKKRYPKKPIIVGGTIIIFAIAGIVGGIVILGEIDKPGGGILVIGVTGTLDSLDPIEGWEEDSSSIITQIVTEALFAVEGIHNGSRLIPNLATRSDWSDNKTELTCYIRKSVDFHDGTPFNATAVKWNIDRIQRLAATEFWIARLWQFPDGNWIINETKVLDEYTVKFVLNKPFAPLRSILAMPVSLMLSPSSTPDNEFNGIIPGTLHGTGAFIYSAYEGGNNVTLSPNPDYWGRRPAFDNVIIKLFPNHTARYEAMLSGELSFTYAGTPWSDEDRVLLMNTTGIELERTPGPYPAMYYFFMNNNLINTTMRKAISYAFNFSAYVNLFGKPTGLPGKPDPSIFPPIRNESPIPKRMLYSHWGSFDMPYYNISIARQALKDANWPGIAGLTANDNISAENEWEMVANSLIPLATYNCTLLSGSPTGLYDVFKETLKQIGVKLELVFVSSYVGNAMLFEYDGYNRNMLGFGVGPFGWGADYNDPYTIINPVFSSKDDEILNYGQINDSLVQQWMEEAVEETDEDAREQIYFNIEKRLIEEVYPVIWCELYFTFDTYVSNLHWLHAPDLGVFTIKDWYFD